jgi:vancomycin resistance protein YoaR
VKLLARFLFAFCLTLGALGVFVAAFALGYSQLNAGRFMPGVSIAGVDVSGLDSQAAKVRLRAALPDLSAGSLTLDIGDTQRIVPYRDFGRDYDFSYMLGAAMQLGRSGLPFAQLQEQIGLLQSGADVPAAMTWDAVRLSQIVMSQVQLAESHPVEATLTRPSGDFAVSPSAPGLSVDAGQAVQEAMAAVAGLSAADAQIELPGTVLEPSVPTAVAQAAADAGERLVAEPLVVSGAGLTTTIDPAVLRGWLHVDETDPANWRVVVDPAAVQQFVADFAASANVAPRNATFKLVSDRIEVVPSQDGVAINVDATVANVLAALQARISGTPASSADLVTGPTPPPLTTQAAQQMAPRVTLLSQWTTHYFPDPALNGNGINIQIPTNILDGYVVDAGATFDFLKAIGPITSPPYEAGGALVHGQIVEDGPIGGGMCSVSTTLFNAALRYGLPITARTNHALYISRYPIGLDATVWEAGPGSRRTMAFVNDTGYPLIIRGINSPRAVTFQLWGIDDGRTVQISDPVIANLQAPDYATYTYTDALLPGKQRKQFDVYEAFNAAVTRTVRNAAGQIVIQETYRSSYRMLGAEYLVGHAPGRAIGKSYTRHVKPIVTPPVSTATGH